MSEKKLSKPGLIKKSARVLKAEIRDGLIYWVYIPVLVLGGGRVIDLVFGLHNIKNLFVLSLVEPVLVTAGAALIFLAMKDLAVHGGGTPNPMVPPRRLVRERSYRFCRHPMFLGYDLAALGIVLYSGSAGSVFVSYPLFIFLQVRFLKKEEKKLEARFGDDFRAYRERVPFLLPLHFAKGK